MVFHGSMFAQAFWVVETILASNREASSLTHLRQFPLGFTVGALKLLDLCGFEWNGIGVVVP